ncbi:MerR family transcriptional regulator [Microtetraspora niveoalba]|uniref:MerR family transcriptional regulator n=1 Tax=Microtetraspora niveoalba TaxID=46175 RepID=UPI000A0397E0|nr:MerR family transcriptional regulator [Microtetraspora niveoalba]
MDEDKRRTPETEGVPVIEHGYGIGAVSRMVGVPIPTLRTWNLRYGIGASGRSPGGHRRYSPADLRCLREMSRLVRSGHMPADAARLALALRQAAQQESVRSFPAVAVERASGHPAERAAGPGEVEERGTRGEGIPTAARLMGAAAALDAHAVAEAVGAALDRYGVEWMWHRLALPVFATICRRQAETGRGVEVEHLFTDRLMAALNALSARPVRPVHPRPVLLACAEDEQHSLPIHALAAALSSERGVETRMLGARTPSSALAAAIRRLNPVAVVVWSQRRETGDPAPLAALPRQRPSSRVIVGGPGWWDGLPSHVIRVSTFREAVAQVMAALT